MDAHQKEHKSHQKEYLIVFFVLGLLTVLELLIPGQHQLSKLQKSSSLIGLAVSKAFIVAYFYMHLKDETKWLKVIAMVPISAVLYTVVLMLESFYR